MSSVSGTNGELAHLIPSLFKSFAESLFRFDWLLEGLEETDLLEEKGWILERVNSARFSLVPSCRGTVFILNRPSITNLELTCTVF